MARRATRNAARRCCAAPGCVTVLPMWKLMCRDHWSRLPGDIQYAVTSAWTRFEMDDWRTACRRAVAWLDANPPEIAK